MTDQELEGMARQALNMALTEAELKGEMGALFATYFDGEGIHRMRKVEEIIGAKFGKGWLDDGDKKDAAFGVLRKATQLFPSPPDAFVIVTPTNMFRPTEKLKAMGLKKQKELSMRGNDYHHQMAREGLMRIVDSFTAVVQTQERVCVASQEVDRGRAVGQPETFCMPQKDFGGRLKMWGEDELEKEAAAEARKTEV